MNKLLSLPDSFLGLFYNFGYSCRFVLLPALSCHVCLLLLSSGMWWGCFWRFSRMSLGTGGCWCSLCQVLLRAAPSLLLEQLCTGEPGWEWAQGKTKLSRKRKRTKILVWVIAEIQNQLYSSNHGSSKGARDEWLKQGQGNGRSSSQKLPWELSVELSFQ